MDPKDTGWLVAGATVASSVLTFACTKGVDAWLRLRKGNLEERKYEDDRTIEGYKKTIDTLTTRVTHLEALLDLQEKKYATELDALRKEHVECVKLQTALTVKSEYQANELADLKSEIKSLRDWRHSIANAAQVEVMKHASEIDP